MVFILNGYPNRINVGKLKFWIYIQYYTSYIFYEESDHINLQERASSVY